MNNPIYRIISIDDNYQTEKKIYARVQVVGTSRMFDKAISELYQPVWLEGFSKEDVAHIAALYTAEHTNNFGLIARLPQTNSMIKPGVLIIAILFTASLILSNITAAKLCAFGVFIFPSALLFFPLTYIFDDILTEVYGFKVSRRIIWSGLFANLIVILGAWFITYLPPADGWPHQAAYEAVFRNTPRVFFASCIAYLLGEFGNSITLAKLKILTSGRFLWLRAMLSSVIGVTIDTILFIHIAFIYTVPYITLWQIIFTAATVKIIYEICAIPLTYRITNYLKRKDNIDHYDFKTKFNPFSLAV